MLIGIDITRSAPSALAASCGSTSAAGFEVDRILPTLTPLVLIRLVMVRTPEYGRTRRQTRRQHLLAWSRDRVDARTREAAATSPRTALAERTCRPERAAPRRHDSQPRHTSHPRLGFDLGVLLGLHCLWSISIGC